MKNTVDIAIDASGKAFDAITRIVEINIVNLRNEALPRRIEAASLLDLSKGMFLLGRNQFTTYRLTGSELAVKECLRLLDESLHHTRQLEHHFRDPKQLEQVAATAKAITAYRESFVNFVTAHTNMQMSQKNVYRLVETIWTESESIISLVNADLEQMQRRDEILTLCITGLAVLVSLLVACGIILSINRPMSDALAFAQRVSDGDYNAQWNNSGKNEFGQLAYSLNKAFSTVADKAFWYESILHSLPFMLATMDKEKKFTFVNNNARFQVQSATPSPWVLASSKKTS